MLFQSFLAGILGGLFVLIAGAIIMSHSKRDGRFKNFKWEDILQKKVLTMREIGDMYLCSVTFGECATGELFGSLDRLKQELPSKVYQLIERAHHEFGNKIAALYTYREYPEHVQRFQLEALAAYRKLKELKTEHKIDFVNPFEVQADVYASMYPTM